MDFGIIWRYFGWSNQTLATIVLWTAGMYLVTKGKKHWIATIPATFMTAVCTSYILIAPEGFKLSQSISYPIGVVGAIVAMVIFLIAAKKVETKSKGKI